MKNKPFRFELLPETFAFCRYRKSSPWPSPGVDRSLFALVETSDETTLILPACEAPSRPPDAREAPWRCFKLRGTFAFTALGILASVSSTLSDARISVCCVSAFSTDYFFVQEKNLAKTLQAFRAKHWEVKSGSV